MTEAIVCLTSEEESNDSSDNEDFLFESNYGESCKVPDLRFLSSTDYKSYDFGNDIDPDAIFFC